MGKGDKKTRRGKIVIGSYGVRRMRKTSKPIPEKVIKVAEKVKVAEVTEEVKPAPEKKTKAPKKETTETKATATKKKKEEPAA
ncbi:MAG: 30S ribosomal protein THX [Bacteroidales bacterium]|jgi:ribosomal small subunit protein bTHX|nr:30S ribosomal protein THX [Bacteroidales bacterium]